MYPFPTIRHRIYRIRRIVKTRGIQAALHYCLTRLNDRLSRLRQEQQNTQTDVPPNDADPFSEFSTPADLRIRSAHVKRGLNYAPSRKDVFGEAIKSLQIHFEDYVFIDLGSGKGQVLLLAAHYAFRRVIGVEYSETLTGIALANVRAATGLTCQSVECICEDARDVDLPHDRAVLYLYHPFEGKVMDKVVRKIEQSLRAVPRDMWIIYVNPMEDRKFKRSRQLKTVAENWGVPNLEFCIYRSII
jgi:SAM-dependent methyltransferase